MPIEFAIEPDLSSTEFVDLLERSTLAERRPVKQPETIEQMLRGASLIVTAREAGLLVGVSRAISDGAYCTYLSDLAVDSHYQRQGIGRELVSRTHAAAGLATNLILLSAPAAQSYYPHIGMTQHDSCWMIAGSTRTKAPPAAEHQPAGVAGPSASPSAQPPAGTKDAVGEFFDSIAGDYESAIERCFPRYPEMLWALLEYLPTSLKNPRILELGCGTGNLSVLLAQRFPASAITLVDLSADSLANCQRRLGADLRFTMEQADMRLLSYPDEAFDLIVSTIAIHHLTGVEKQELFARCRRWLRPGGMLTFADQFSAATEENNSRHMENWQKISRAAGASQAEWSMWMEHQAEHDHHDSLTDQLDWLQRAGFAQLDCPWRYLLWTIVQGRRP